MSRFRVGVIGGGRVGSVLTRALIDAGHELVGVSARSVASRERTRNLLGAVEFCSPAELVVRADVVLLTVPDDALAAVASELEWRPGQMVVHASGRYGIGVLDAVRAAGAVPLALHPAMTFTGTELDLPRLSGCCFGVTADPSALIVARGLVSDLGGEPVVIAEADRPLYHAALAHGANYLITLIGQAREILAGIGVPDPGRLLAPVVQASADNALRFGEQALTGPIARGDSGTVADHVAVLAGSSADIGATYRAMGAATVDRAVRDGRLDVTAAEGVRRVLASGVQE